MCIVQRHNISNNLYILHLYLPTHNAIAPTEHVFAALKDLPTWETWHQRFGHIAYNSLQYLHNLKLVTDLPSICTVQNLIVWPILRPSTLPCHLALSYITAHLGNSSYWPMEEVPNSINMWEYVLHPLCGWLKLICHCRILKTKESGSITCMKSFNTSLDPCHATPSYLCGPQEWVPECRAWGVVPGT